MLLLVYNQLAILHNPYKPLAKNRSIKVGRSSVASQAARLVAGGPGRHTIARSSSVSWTTSWWSFSCQMASGRSEFRSFPRPLALWRGLGPVSPSAMFQELSGQRSRSMPCQLRSSLNCFFYAGKR